MTVPYTFGTATTSIPLSNLDANFNTPITLGNTSIYLGNTTTTIGNLTLTNATISSGNVTISNITVTTANVTTANVATLSVTGTATISTANITTANITTGNITTLTSTSITDSGLTSGRVTYAGASGLLSDSANLTYNGTNLNISYADAAYNAGLTVTNTTNNIASQTKIYVLNSAGNYLSIGRNSTALGSQSAIFSTGNFPLEFYTDSTQRMTITGTGSVGIGTSSPTALLTLGGVAATGYESFLSTGTTTAYNFATMSNTGSNLRIGIESATAVGLLTGSSNYSGVIGTLTATSLHLGTNSTVRATIDSAGNVGIGTTSPTSFGGFKTLELANSSGNAISLVTGTSVIAQTIASNTNSLVYTGSRSNHSLVFTTNDTERMRLDTSGNLLVGTTSVPTTARTKGFAAKPSSSGGISIYQTDNVSDWGITATSGSIVNFYSDTGSALTYAGTISVNGIVTTYGSVSDYRLKENIVPMTGALAKVAQLKPVTYKWKLNGSDGQGFIAHELQAVVPDCVTGEKDAIDEDGKPKYQAMDTSHLVATLVSAIQEQQALIESLTTRLTALENK